jgi:outer membrane immunogenic protein
MQVIELAKLKSRQRLQRAAIAVVVAAGVNAGIGSAALAADLRAPAPVYTKAPPAPAAYNWTGFYLGGNVGYSWGKTGTDYSVNSIPPGLAAAVSQDSIHMDGLIGGGQLGYNYQFDRQFLAGIEADFQGSGEKQRHGLQTCNINSFLSPCDTTNVFDGYTEKLEAFGTIRGRLGYLPDPRWLLYVTGGFAEGKLTRADTLSFDDAGAVIPHAIPPVATSISGWRSGWTAGGGIEAAIWDKWTWKAEYLYLQLSGLGATQVTLPNALSQVTTSHQFTDNIVRVGLNYRFAQ